MRGELDEFVEGFREVAPKTCQNRPWYVSEIRS